MRLWAVFRKTLREQRRDLWVLSLSLSMGPFFAILYWAFFGATSSTYSVLLMDAASRRSHPSAVHSALLRTQSVRTELVRDRATAVARLRDRSADALLLIPDGFASSVRPRLRMVGDLTNPRYPVAAILAYSAVEAYVVKATGATRPLSMVEEPIGASGSRTEFEAYVPGLLVLSVILLIYQVAMSVARELEAGTLLRLRLTPLSPGEFLGGLSLVHVLVGMLSVCITFATAWCLGFRSQGPLWVAVVVGAIATLPVVGIGLVVASLSRTVSQAFVVANFPLMLLMFFSGAIFPLPKILPFSALGHDWSLFDVLPPSHAVIALNKVLTMGADLKDVVPELAALVLLSVAYFGVGAAIFGRVHRRAGG